MSITSRFNFADRVMCVGFSASCFGTSLTDEEATQKLRADNEASGGRVVKDRLKEMFAPIQRVIRQARLDYREATLPGISNDLRLIPNAQLPLLRDKIESSKRRIDAAFDVQIPQYQRFVDMDRSKYNGLFKQADYPDDPERLRETVELSLTYSDLPAGDFQRLAGIATAEVERLNRQFNDRMLTMGNQARNEVHRKMVELIKHIADKLSDPEAKHYHESTFQNLKDYLALVPDLNITGDPLLEQMRAEATQNLNFTMAQVKDSEMQKLIAAERAKTILNRFGQVGGGRKILAV